MRRRERGKEGGRRRGEKGRGESEKREAYGLLRGDCGTGGLELGDLGTEGGPAGQAMGEVGRESIKGIFEAHNYNSQSGIHLIWVCARLAANISTSVYQPVWASSASYQLGVYIYMYAP